MSAASAARFADASHAAPDHARAARIREKSDTAKAHLDRRGPIGPSRAPRAPRRVFRRRASAIAWPINFSVTCIPSGRTQRAPAAQRLQSRDQIAKRLTHVVRQIERHEKPHAQAPPVSGETENTAAPDPARLRGKTADALAVAGEANTFSRGPRSSAMPMCTSPTGFSGVPPPGPAIPVTPDAQRRARALANAVGQRQRHFGAHGSFRFDQLRRHAQPGSSSARCCSRPRHRENRPSCPAHSSAARPAGRRCSFPRPQSWRDFRSADCATTSSSDLSVRRKEMLAERQRHALDQSRRAASPPWRDRPTTCSDEAECPSATPEWSSPCRDTARRAARRAARLPIRAIR